MFLYLLIHLYILEKQLILNFFLTIYVDYKHGLNFQIFNIHFIHILILYIFISISIYWNFVLILKKKKFIFIYLKIYIEFIIFNLFILVLTGIIWSWTQWGILYFIDSKILILLLIFIYYFILLILLYYNINLFILFYFNIYILYHLPILKYNVFWNSEMHQKKSNYLFYSFIQNNEFFNLNIFIYWYIISCYLFLYYIKYLNILYKKYLYLL